MQVEATVKTVYDACGNGHSMTVRITIPKLTEEQMKNESNIMIVTGMSNTAKVCTPFAQVEKAVLLSNDGLNMDQVKECDIRVVLPSLKEELDSRSTDSFHALLTSLMISASVIKPNVYIDTYIPVPEGLVLPATEVSQTAQGEERVPQVPHPPQSEATGVPESHGPSSLVPEEDHRLQGTNATLRSLPPPIPGGDTGTFSLPPLPPLPDSGQGLLPPPPLPGSGQGQQAPQDPTGGEDDSEVVTLVPALIQRGRGGRGRGRARKHSREDVNPVSNPSNAQRQEGEPSRRRSTRGDQPSPAVPGCDDESPGSRLAIRGAGAIESSPKRFKRPPGRARKNMMWNEILGVWIHGPD